MYRLLGVAALLLLTQGCAYQLAMRRGAASAARGDWAEAAEAYAVAAEKHPDDPELEKKLESARAKAIEAEVAAAREALGRGDYEAAVASLKKAETYNADDPEVYTAMREVEQAMEAAILRDWQSKDPRDIYALAIRAQKLFPKAAWLPAMLQHLRQHFIAQSEKLFDQRKFDVALAALATIPEFEPDQSSVIAPLQQRVKTAWADTLVADAARHAKAGRSGAAAISYVRAFEIAERQADLAAGRKLAAPLAAEARLTVKLEVTGPPERVLTLRTAIQKGIEGIPDTISMTTASAELTLTLTATPQRCTETDTVTPATKDYISGKVEKPNPEHQALTKALNEALAEEKAAKAEAELLWPKLKAAEAEVGKFDAAWQTAKTASEQAEAAYEQAKTQLDSARTRRDEIDSQMDAARAQNQDLSALGAQFNEATKRVTEWTDVLLKREDDTEAARRALSKIDAVRQPAFERKEVIAASYKAATDRRLAASDRLTQLTSQLSSTPKTIWEDVHETLRYDIHDWVRACTAPASGKVVTSWATLLPKSHTFTPESRTTDQSHIGHALSGLALDPKSFPDKDPALVEAADQATAQEVVRWATALADDHFARRTASAVEAWEVKPDVAASDIVSLYLGAKSRLAPETATSFESALKARFGIEDLSRLSP